MSDTSWLLADIGGTNARFATADGQSLALTQQRTLATADFATLSEAIDHYLAITGQRFPTGICAAVAGPVVEGRARLTNHYWEISTADLQSRPAVRTARVLNDFEAIAYALPELGMHHSCSLGGPAIQISDSRQSLAVIGPGTGLGASGLISCAGRSTPIISEAGHVGFAPETERQRLIHDRLQQRFDRVSDERLASGQGIENIYWALNGQGPEEKNASLSAASIFERHAAGTDPIASDSVAEFFRILGQVAGNLALTLGAFGGVCIAGGIAQRHKQLIQASEFRSGFEAKGRHRSLMETIPTRLVEHPQPGLLGALLAIRG